MWTTESLWFEIAVVSIIYALGNILMGHFEERTPKIRRVGKYLLTLLIVCGISLSLGRIVSMTFLASFIIPLLFVHAYYLPKRKGINGWTGEPKSKYYAFVSGTKKYFLNDKPTTSEGKNPYHRFGRISRLHWYAGF